MMLRPANDNKFCSLDVNSVIIQKLPIIEIPTGIVARCWVSESPTPDFAFGAA
jgi:hypothetical protein